ncbi:hypothetical protein V5O48_016039 [Marasmius crinis-equi]|uniref:Uncharacterized protein n=1 Tax=Marasmius crinis-equi TaxID=585013 RepID=A0ABR3ESX1_9AGAR
MSTLGPDSQNALFTSPSSPSSQPIVPLDSEVPQNLQRATHRLQFPPSYVVVGVYRLFTDRTLYVPAWQKCKHGTVRGGVVGAVWAFLTFGVQRKFVEVFLVNQVTYILRFFLSRNIRIARDRLYDQTVISRGKTPDFWQPYVEEWERPPRVDMKESWIEKVAGGWFGAFVVKRVLLAPLALYPFVGIVVSAWFKGLGTARMLHRRYFEAKKMTHEQIAVFMEERKWEYRAFGFTAALLESIPILGLVFTVSNRIGAAMWAHDLEKRQHYVAEKKQKKL